MRNQMVLNLLLMLHQLLAKHTSDNNGTIIAAIIGAIGLVIASVITVVSQIFARRPILKKRSKRTSDPIISNRTYQERSRVYREAIKIDPRISTLQILDMSRPLKVANVYVRLQLQEQVSTGYKVSEDLLQAESSKDPNILLKAEQGYLEKRLRLSFDPEYAVLTFKRCVVVGDPGAGKTTLLKYLALKSAFGKSTGLPPFPIHIELNAFAISNQSDLLSFAASTWQDRYGFPNAMALNCMKKGLEDCNAILLLDALDETVIGNTFNDAENRYKFIAQKIVDLSTRYPQSTIVITARKAGYHQRAIRLHGFHEFEVLDFRLEDIRLFIDQWFASVSPTKNANAADLKLKLEHNSRLQTLGVS